MGSPNQGERRDWRLIHRPAVSINLGLRRTDGEGRRGVQSISPRCRQHRLLHVTASGMDANVLV